MDSARINVLTLKVASIKQLNYVLFTCRFIEVEQLLHLSAQSHIFDGMLL